MTAAVQALQSRPWLLVNGIKIAAAAVLALFSLYSAMFGVFQDTVLNGFGAPLHPGALRYYREIGVPGIEEFVTRTAK